MIPRVSISLAKCSAGRFRPIASVDASVAPARIDLVDEPDHRVEIGLARAAGDLDLEQIALMDRDDLRSEEHTSELQSLMRISYAVFCMKKKTNTTNKPTNRIKH